MIRSALAWLHNPTWWTGEPPPGAILTALLIIGILCALARLEKKLEAENTRHDAEVERRYRERERTR